MMDERGVEQKVAFVVESLCFCSRIDPGNSRVKVGLMSKLIW